MNKNGKRNAGFLYATLAIVFWSTVASAFKISLRYLDHLQLLFFASISSTISLFIILIIQKKLSLIRTYSGKEFIHSLALGTLNPFLYYFALFKAYSLLPAQEAQPLNYTWPIMLVLLSAPLLRQKITIRSIIAITISFLGIFIISTEGHITSIRFTNLSGALLALGSSVIWALFWLYNTRDGRDVVAKLFLNFLFGFPFVLVTTIVFSEIKIPSIYGLFGAIYIGVFEMGVSFVLWLNALKSSRTIAELSNLVYITPFLSLVFTYIVVGEKILLPSVLGLGLIVSGILPQSLKQGRLKSPIAWLKICNRYIYLWNHSSSRSRNRK